jgi:dTMP kinase
LSLFIVFEGGEGSGKSTQTRMLCEHLEKSGIPVLLVHEPGYTPLGNEIRQWLKGNIGIDPVTELLLFEASRVELVKNIIRPALASGTVVICDRFYHSTIAYQGYGRGLDLKLIETLNKIATGGLEPDLVIFFDADIGKALERKHYKDHFDLEDIAFHQRVKEGYLKMARAERKRWVTIDGLQTKDAIAQAVWEKISAFLPSR